MIMRKQRKKLLNKNLILNQKRNPHMLVGSKFRKLKHIFQRSFKNKFGKKYVAPPSRSVPDLPPKNKMKLPESSISTSSYDTRQFRPKENFTKNKKYTYRKKSSGSSNRKDRASTSEDSDFVSVKRNKIKNQNFPSMNTQNRHSSSGYVSCSECSYDSDTCTCTSADKCYCSLGQRNCSKPRKGNRCYCSQDVVFCGCDTDSCAESNKCYCPNQSQTNTKVIDDLRMMENDNVKHKKLCKNNSNTKSTRSLEYILNPSESYYEKYKSKPKYGTKNSMPIMRNERINNEYDFMSVSHNNLKNSRRRSVHGGEFGIFTKGYEFCPPVTVKSYGSIRSHQACEYTRILECIFFNCNFQLQLFTQQQLRQVLVQKLCLLRNQQKLQPSSQTSN